MPDWNPAEIIGIRPRPLALSLYKRLITDGTWAYQRNNYGYKNLRGFPLMIDFEGLPYIDTRVSFNSFIPKDIDAPLSSKLADYYLDKLGEQPDKHDKVEFEIIFSCYTFDLPKRIQTLLKNGFTENEIARLTDSLRNLTNHIINPIDGLWISDLERIRNLEKRREIVSTSSLNIIPKIYWLLQDCVRYGTLPFAGLARGGFIAVLLLKSLVSIGILSASDYQHYMGSLNTVSTQMGVDRRTLSLNAFIKKYGHLRPGTYDILSNRYDADPGLYFSNWAEEPLQVEEREPFTLTLEQYQAIQRQMKEHGLQGDVLALFQFIKAGIEGREYAKFVFTKSLSDAIELIAQLGGEYGFTREELSYLDISVIDTLYSSSTDIKKCMANSIARGKEKYAAELGITLPPVIMSPDDIYSFFMPTDTPNFITMKTVCAPVETKLSNADGIKGKILLISAADPGYDWIFSHGIKGFITAYGGANSHMAIRAGELGIPAVIGVGEKMFAQYCCARSITIDCANKKIAAMR